jgi:uncharacterized repeat protein (TIGR03803 family)
MSHWKTARFALVVFAAMTVGSSAQTFTVLANFTNGAVGVSSLVQGRDGNFYGTSQQGGRGNYGTVFKVTPAGRLTTLYHFCSQPNCTDGFSPVGALVLGTDGNFYGTTQNGGANNMGLVFKITPTGSYTVIHSFDGTDGLAPDAGLALGFDKNFYGTTDAGGMSGLGTVFQVTPVGVVTTLHSFNGTDGDYPQAPVIQGSDGDFYGTTLAGGLSIQCFPFYDGCGTVFKITTSGTFTSLANFDGTNGATPFAPVIQASNGSFYGTTFSGGYTTESYEGTVFRMESDGQIKVVHVFNFGVSGSPYDGLIQATDGNLYGAATGGGPSDSGYIFTVSPTGVFTIVFDQGYTTAMVQGTGGKLYGTQGSNIFSLDMGLGPFVTFVLPVASSGQTAQILGQGLTGTTSVTFNGIAAEKFTVVSDTYLTAVVPAGATTGAVVVATPAGDLTSNVSFRIGK